MSKDTKKEEIIEDFPKIIRLSSSGEHPELGAGTFLTVEKREFYNWLSDKLDLYAEQVRRETIIRIKPGLIVVRNDIEEVEGRHSADALTEYIRSLNPKEHPQHD